MSIYKKKFYYPSFRVYKLNADTIDSNNLGLLYEYASLRENDPNNLSVAAHQLLIQHS